MTDREQVAREVRELRFPLCEPQDLTPSAGDFAVADFILQRESALRDEVEAYKKQSVCKECGAHHFNVTLCSICVFSRGKSHLSAHVHLIWRI